MCVISFELDVCWIWDDCVYNIQCCCRLLSLSTNSSLTISSNYANCTLKQTDQISLAIENNNNNKGKRRRKKKQQYFSLVWTEEADFAMWLPHRTIVLFVFTSPNRTVPCDCCRGSCLYESLNIYISNTNQ